MWIGLAKYFLEGTDQILSCSNTSSYFWNTSARNVPSHPVFVWLQLWLGLKLLQFLPCQYISKSQELSLWKFLNNFPTHSPGIFIAKGRGKSPIAISSSTLACRVTELWQAAQIIPDCGKCEWYSIPSMPNSVNSSPMFSQVWERPFNNISQKKQRPRQMQSPLGMLVRIWLLLREREQHPSSNPWQTPNMLLLRQANM